MKEKLEMLATVAVVAAALIVAAANVQNVLFREKGPSTINADLAEETFRLAPELWAEIQRSGVLVGDSDAAIEVAVFSDLECPFCKQFHETVIELQRELGRDHVAYRFVHFPIGNHRFARPAARAAECAATSGDFGPFLDTVFAKQDSLGLKS